MKRYFVIIGTLLLLVSGALNYCYAEAIQSQANPSSPSAEISYEVTPLVNRAYYDAVNKALKKAKKSILVVMYVMNEGKHASDPPQVLLNNLVKAHKKGVRVEVLLEKPKSTRSSIYRTNLEAYQFLRSKGIKVSFDSPQHDTHTKLVVIDERIIFVGNHNWTTAALLFNNELSLMVEASFPDPRYREYFKKIPR